MTLPSKYDGTFVEPIVDTSAQAGGLYTAAHETRMLLANEGLHANALLTRMSYNWPWPGGAPTLISSGVLQKTFQMPPTDDSHNGADALIPWCSHPGVVAVGAEIYVALYSKYMAFKVSLHGRTFIDAVANANGMQVEVRPTMSPTGEWNRGTTRPSIGRVHVFVEPTYPASRRVALVVQGQWVPMNADGSNVSTQRTAKIVAMRLYDIPPDNKR